jgi:hypothetical protein
MDKRIEANELNGTQVEKSITLIPSNANIFRLLFLDYMISNHSP